MVTLALALAAVLAAAPQEPPPAPRADPPQAERTPPDPAKVEATVKDLKAALAQPKADVALAAIHSAAEVVHADIAAALAAGIKHREPTVRSGAIEALRWMDHPKALEELHAAYRRDKELAKDEQIYTALIKAIGQHGSALSIEILSDNAFAGTNYWAIQARILGLARIRDAKAVAELMAMLQKVGRGKSAPYIDEFRLALMQLTGTDQGKSAELWLKWWGEHKKDFRVPAEEPVLPPPLRKSWDAYWGVRRAEARGEKREDRGNDGETD